MTSFNVCAHVGCYEKIAYEIGTIPDKYCKDHRNRHPVPEHPEQSKFEV